MQRVCIYAVAFLLLCAPGPAFAEQSQSRAELVTGKRVEPLPGWRNFCKEYAPVCDVAPAERLVAILTPEMRADLEEVNRTVNRQIKFMSDLEHWGNSTTPLYRNPKDRDDVDRWDYAEDGYGDCEDYALRKQKILLEKGWPRSAVLLTHVEHHKGDMRFGHLLLTVRTNRGDLILDNDDSPSPILRWWEANYTFLSRQSEEDPNVWLALSKPPTLISSKDN